MITPKCSPCRDYLVSCHYMWLSKNYLHAFSSQELTTSKYSLFHFQEDPWLWLSFSVLKVSSSLILPSWPGKTLEKEFTSSPWYSPWYSNWLAHMMISEIPSSFLSGWSVTGATTIIWGSLCAPLKIEFSELNKVASDQHTECQNLSSYNLATSLSPGP